MEELDINQNVEIVKSTSCKEVGSVMSQHEALRRATLIKHRKVSTQLKLDMVQRQLSHLHRSTTSPDSDRQFYREQMRELSSELEDLGSSQDRAEQIAFRARSRLLRQCGLESQQSLAASNPNLSRSGSRGSLKHRVCHLVSSSPRFRKSRHLFGELRAVASLSSLSVKATSPTGSEEDSPKTDQPQRSWRSPLRFLGHLVATRRKLWSSTKRTKSADNILEEERQLPQRRRLSSSKDESSSESSSRSEEESEEEEEEEVWRREERTPPRYATRAPPVVRKISAGQMRAQVDPALLAEIEDFERMAAQYIKQHS